MVRTLARPSYIVRRSIRSLLVQWPLALKDYVEGIHQTRVASRRLREFVPVLAGRGDAAAARVLRGRLRDLTRLLGRIRELDVALETLVALETSHPDHAPAVAVVRRHVRRERARARRDMRQAVASVDVDWLAAGTRDLAMRLATPRTVRACARRAAARLERRAHQVEQAVLDAGLIYAPGPLHRVRIALKKFRYALEIAERLGRFRLTGTLRRLKGMQDLLGDLHDLQVLVGHVRDVVALSRRSRRHSLDALVDDIDDAVRVLHSRFVTDRESLVSLLARSNDVRRTLTALPAPANASRAPVRTRSHTMEET